MTVSKISKYRINLLTEITIQGFKVKMSPLPHIPLYDVQSSMNSIL